MRTKLADLHDLIRAGDRRGAILFAAKFPRLGPHKDAIHKGREALLRPDFQRSLGRDPAVLVDLAWAAVLKGWSPPT